MISRIIRFLYYSLFFVLPLLMYPRTSELFEFNKMLLIYGFSAIIGFLVGLEFIFKRKKMIQTGILDWSLGAFFVALSLSTLFSIDRHTSLFGYYGRFNGGLLSIISYIVLFYCFISTFVKKVHLYILLKTSLVSSFLVILWGMPGKFGYDLSCYLFTGQLSNACWSDQFRPQDRIFSTLGQPNWLGAYLAVNFFIGAYFFFSRIDQTSRIKSIVLSWLYGIYLTLNLASILFTRSRSALTAWLLGITIFYVFFICTMIYKKESFSKVKSFILVVVCAIVVLACKTGIEKIDQNLAAFRTFIPAGTVIQNQSDKKESVQLPSEVTESLDIRKIVWKGAWELGLRYPLFGTGVETFAYSYYFTRPQEHNLTSEWDFIYNKAHNEYLNYLATTGFIGLGAYLLLIGIVIFNFQSSIFNKFSNKKNKNWEEIQDSRLLHICLFISYITILITNFFGFSTTSINLFFYLIPGFLIASSSFESLKQSPDRHMAYQDSAPHQNSIADGIAVLALSSIVIFILLFLVNYFRADVTYAKADSYAEQGDYQSAFHAYDQALKTHYEHVYQDKFSYTLANVAYLASYEKEKSTAIQLIKLSQYFNQESLKAAPYNILYWKTKAKNSYLYYQVTENARDLEVGISALKTGEKLSPNDPKIYYTEAILYDGTNKSALAQSAVDKAIKLKPNFRDGYLLKAQLLKKYGKKEQSIRAIEYILKKINPDDQEAKNLLKDL